MKNKKVTGPYLVEKLLETLTKMKNFEVFFGNCYCDPDSTSKVKRWDNKSKTYIDINCLTAVQEYNKSMEEVDLADTLFVLYRTTIKSKRWYLKILFHCVDIAKINAWLLYKRHCDQQKVPKKLQMSLLKFTS